MGAHLLRTVTAASRFARRIDLGWNRDRCLAADQFEYAQGGVNGCGLSDHLNTGIGIGGIHLVNEITELPAQALATRLFVGPGGQR